MMSQGTLRVSRANEAVRCGMCQKERHNARECKANVIGKTPWERKKRLQKEKSISFYKRNLLYAKC